MELDCQGFSVTLFIYIANPPINFNYLSFRYSNSPFSINKDAQNRLSVPLNFYFFGRLYKFGILIQGIL